MYNCFTRHVLLVFLVVLSFEAFPQSTKIDSLKNAVRSQQDTSQINSLVQLSFAFMDDEHADSAILHAKRALDQAGDIEFSNGIMKSHFALGRAFQERGAYKTAMRHLIESLSLAEELGNQEALFAIYLYLGKNHRLRAETAGSITDIPDALKNYRRARNLPWARGKKAHMTADCMQILLSWVSLFVINFS